MFDVSFSRDFRKRVFLGLASRKKGLKKEAFGVDIRGLLSLFLGLVSLTVLPARSLAFAQSTVCGGMSGPTALRCIQFNYSPTATMGYDSARDVLYRDIDSNDSGELEGIYSGYSITLTPGEDPSADAFSKDVNAEHVFPQSMGAGSEPAKSDLHNLYPARVEVNSARSNIPFGESPDSETDTWYYLDETRSSVPDSNIDAYSERLGSSVWEPRESREGDVARAALYFYAIYESRANDDFFSGMKDRLLEWHKRDPITETERDRSAAIASEQGNKNPFVVDETLAERAFRTADPEPTLVFNSAMTTARETDSSATLTVRYDDTSGTAADVEVVFEESQSTATAADLDGYTSKTVSFPSSASDGATRTVSVPLTDDNETEGLEEAHFELKNVQSSGSVQVGRPGTTSLKILDDENPLVLNEVLADPAPGLDGDANQDGIRSARDDEFIEIYNTSTTEEVNLSGYKYVDEEVGIRHVFPQGTVVPPEQSVVVFGGGRPAESIPGVVQTASEGTLGLDNDGDTLAIVTEDDNEVLRYKYKGDIEDESMTRDPDFTGPFQGHSTASGAGGALFSPGRTNAGTPLPVELASLDASLSGTSEKRVVLSWKTASETNNAGFAVQRRAEDGDWAAIGFKDGAGTTTTPQTYRFVDRHLPFDAEHLSYRLKQIDTDGASRLTREISIARSDASELELRVPFPNPASGPVTVQYAVPRQMTRSGEVRIELFDMLGRRIRTVVAKGRTPEANSLTGRGEVRMSTTGLSSGTYFFRLTAGDQSRTQQLTVVK